MQNKSVPPALAAALGREPEQPLHSAINSHRIPSTKTNLQNKSVGADDLVAPWWRTGRTPVRLHQPTQYRFYKGKNADKPLGESTARVGAENRASVDLPLPVLSVQLAGSSLTCFNAQTYEVGC